MHNAVYIAIAVMWAATQLYEYITRKLAYFLISYYIEQEDEKAL